MPSKATAGVCNPDCLRASKATVGASLPVDAIKSNGGGVQPRLFEGKGSGSGIDKKEVAVWKLPDN
jgi:hypothetical protein